MKKSDKPLIIAQIVGKWVGGGVESVLMNYYRNIDRAKIQFDFICDEDSTNIPYDEIKKLGGRVLFVPPYQKIFKYNKALKKIFKENNYKIVHSNINTLSVFPLRIAKKCGIPVRISHSHSTSNKKEWKKNLLKNILKPFSRKYATDYFACSELAGRYLFGDKAFNNGKVTIINNAINLNKFKYNEKTRNRLRRQLKIDDDTLVIGHIGRFVEQKNHTFLIDLFSELHKENSNSILLLIGQGPLENKIKEKVNSLNITDSVKFLGQRTDVNELYNVMDVFVLPSLYEGLGVVLIEAQANGLQCLVSQNVPKEVGISDLLKIIDINDEPANAIKYISKNDILRKNAKLKENNYNILNEKSKLEKFYIKNYFIPKRYIELFGMPGSGKTYFATHNLKRKFNINQIILKKKKIYRILKKISLLFYLKNNYNSDYLKVKYFIKNIEFNKKIKKIKMYFYLSSTLSLLKKYENNSNICFEEGLLQVLFGILYCVKDYKKTISLYFELFYDYLINSKIYYLKTNILVIKERLEKRHSIGGSELEHDINKNIYALENAQELIDLILKELKNQNIKYDIIE